MKFYRVARIEDFDKRFEVHISHFEKYLPRDVEALIEKEKFNEAVLLLRKMKGFGITDSKKYCARYKSFYEAKQDFLNGVCVYTEY